MLAVAAIGVSSAAFAETPTATNAEWKTMVQRLSQGMADKDGMVTRQQFLVTMGKKFDAMDTGGKGMIPTKSVEEILADLAIRPGPGQ